MTRYSTPWDSTPERLYSDYDTVKADYTRMCLEFARSIEKMLDGHAPRDGHYPLDDAPEVSRLKYPTPAHWLAANLADAVTEHITSEFYAACKSGD